MQCSSCGKTGFVVVSGKRYCSSCGAKFADQGGPRAMSDIKPSAAKPVADVPAAPAPVPAAPVADVATTANPAEPVAIPVTKPAAQFHGGNVGATGAGVLDLRAAQPAETSTGAQPSQPTAELLLEEHATDGTPSEVPVAVTVAPTTTAITQPTPSISPALVHAPVITSQQAAPEPAVPAPAPVDLAAAPTTAQANPLFKRFPEHPAVVPSASAAPVATPATSNDLPGQVATQLEALQAQMGLAPAAAAAPAPTTAPDLTTTPSLAQSPDLKQALAAAKPNATSSVLKVGAALAAIAIMGGFVWLQNSPKLAFHAAASKAGIEASLPTYIPSSYHQSGPANVGDGQLTLNFRSPSSSDPLQITQKRTAWDSNSLRENFITRQSDNYVAVSGQGLTIFLYNDNASWVNHGIWYSVSGTAKLSREQILKVAYGL